MAFDKAHVPTLLSLARLAAGPVIAALIVAGQQLAFADGGVTAARLYLIATALFVAAALTDWIDGVLARRWNVVSPLGAALDHVADKVLVACALLALAYAALPLDLVAAAILLIGRDLAIAGLRERFGADMAVDGYGKTKAAAAMAGVAFFLAGQSWVLIAGGDAVSMALFWLARTLLWTAAALALLSGARYLHAAMRAAR